MIGSFALNSPKALHEEDGAIIERETTKKALISSAPLSSKN